MSFKQGQPIFFVHDLKGKQARLQTSSTYKWLLDEHVYTLNSSMGIKDGNCMSLFSETSSFMVSSVNFFRRQQLFKKKVWIF